ncbi:uncharacterized protein LOC131329151 isoform X2 [Rhododendron vialii]|uniref:uncharacterized protein LOC131329151 isoform X2 n=1 Tax=Rhododendron vialii TaxID=182163 RepID=UPI00265EB15E|nr:uncharacterized protein LOC131329151 isoform X2 [Rhododendron vialii]
MGGGGGRVEAVNSKGCTRLFGDISFSSSFRSMRSFESMSSPASTSSVLSGTPVVVVAKSTGPFSGLVICVTGLSKESRKQVKDAAEGLGGQYSPNLHPQFRLSESLYSVEGIGENVVMQGHARQSHMAMAFPEKESNRSLGSTFSGLSFYIDTDISPELQHKVVEAAAVEGAEFVDQWFVGCNVSHVVCEGPSVQKYIGHSCNLVSPVWVMKTAREKRMHRLVHMSADMAREVGIILEDSQHGIYGEGINGDIGSQAAPSSRINASQEERQKIVNLAKNGVRKRRGRRMQTCKIPIRPITPISLLDSICWSISEPTSTASVYTDSFIVEDASEHHAPVCFDAKGDGKESESAFVNFSRPLMESEKTELIFRNQFFTILFPVDRFAEIGPCSRTFVSDTGFTCLQVLDHIHAFYQENMSCQEIDAAIHTDSRHADQLRSVYSSKETEERGYVAFKRIDFLGSRKSFELLKRVNGDNNSNVYELLIRA